MLVKAAIVYSFTAKKSLAEIRQMYFKLKDEVFARDRMGFAYNTDALESILKEGLGEDTLMSDCQFPRCTSSAMHIVNFKALFTQ